MRNQNCLEFQNQWWLGDYRAVKAAFKGFSFFFYHKRISCETITGDISKYFLNLKGD